MSPKRAFQTERSGQWTSSKRCENFGPADPWLVARDAVPDPQNLPMWPKVNGQTMHNGSTATMVYGALLVSHLSQAFTLHPGDVVELVIEGPGNQRHTGEQG